MRLDSWLWPHYLNGQFTPKWPVPLCSICPLLTDQQGKMTSQVWHRFFLYLCYNFNMWKATDSQQNLVLGCTYRQLHHFNMHWKFVWTLFLRSTDLVPDDGSVGGNPKPLTWKTESSYQPTGKRNMTCYWFNLIAYLFFLHFLYCSCSRSCYLTLC